MFFFSFYHTFFFFYIIRSNWGECQFRLQVVFPFFPCGRGLRLVMVGHTTWSAYSLYADHSWVEILWYSYVTMSAFLSWCLFILADCINISKVLWNYFMLLLCLPLTLVKSLLFHPSSTNYPVLVVMQSIIPGILQGDKSDSLLYGSVDNGKKICWNEAFHAKVRCLL